VNFFQAQDSARRSTLWLVVLFVLAVVGLVGLTNALVMVVIVYKGTGNFISSWSEFATYYDGATFWKVGVMVVAIVAGGSLYKSIQLSAGGRVVAELLGGQIIPQNSRELDQRKILNVVEEMAIASGTPVPPVYLIDGFGINAFAAGNTPNDAVIGITRGALSHLTRDELQGVIAHEFSHILNGDMRLNMRLTGVLHGILVLGMLGYYLVRSLRYARSSRSREGGSAIAALLALGVGLMVIGFCGTFFGQWIKALVSRQREYLADASAVQFTRNPDGIGGALKKIGGLRAGGEILAPAAPEFSHAYFAQGVSFMVAGLFATHPPLKARIRRIDPRWDGRFIEPKPVAREAPQPRAEEERQDKVKLGMAAAVADVMRAVERVGQPGQAHMEQGKALIDAIPESVRIETQDPYGGQAVIYALLADPLPEQRQTQWDLLSQTTDAPLLKKTQALATAIGTLPRAARLPLMEMSMPALRAMSTKQYAAFRNTVAVLIGADKRITLFEWVMERLLIHQLDQAFGLAKAVKAKHAILGAVKQPMETVLSLLAYTEHADAAGARQAFEAGKKASGAFALKMVPKEAIDLQQLSASMDELRKVKPLLKPRILTACVACVGADGAITDAGAELLRVVAAALDCPMPPLVAAVKAGSHPRTG